MKIQTTRTAYNKRLESAIGKFERDTALKPTVKKLRSIISNSQKSKSSVSTLTSDNSFHRNVLLTSLLASQIVPVDSLSRPSADNSTSPFFPPNHLKYPSTIHNQSSLVRRNFPPQTQLISSKIIIKRKDPKDRQQAIVESIDQSPQAKFKFLLE